MTSQNTKHQTPNTKEAPNSNPQKRLRTIEFWSLNPGVSLVFGVWCLVFGSPTAALHAAEPTPAQLQFFETRIRPVLVQNCYKCHSHQSEKVRAGLLLDTREGVLRGGETGPAIVPGDLQKSLLVKAISYTDDDLQMPPNGDKLPPAVIADLVAWVKMGAPDPRTGSTAQWARRYVIYCPT